MAARARHDRGDRRIDPDAEAYGIGVSIQAVQPVARQPAPDLIRDARACADNRGTDPDQPPFAADKVH
jgi:hypothetical protein